MDRKHKAVALLVACAAGAATIGAVGLALIGRDPLLKPLGRTRYPAGASREERIGGFPCSPVTYEYRYRLGRAGLHQIYAGYDPDPDPGTGASIIDASAQPSPITAWTTIAINATPKPTKSPPRETTLSIHIPMPVAQPHKLRQGLVHAA